MDQISSIVKEEPDGDVGALIETYQPLNETIQPQIETILSESKDNSHGLREVTRKLAFEESESHLNQEVQIGFDQKLTSLNSIMKSHLTTYQL